MSSKTTIKVVVDYMGVLIGKGLDVVGSTTMEVEADDTVAIGWKEGGNEDCY